MGVGKARQRADPEATDLLDEFRVVGGLGQDRIRRTQQRVHVHALDALHRLLDRLAVPLEGVDGTDPGRGHAHRVATERLRGAGEREQAIAAGGRVAKEVQRLVIHQHQDRATRLVGAVAEPFEVGPGLAAQHRRGQVHAAETQVLRGETRHVQQVSRGGPFCTLPGAMQAALIVRMVWTCTARGSRPESSKVPRYAP